MQPDQTSSRLNLERYYNRWGHKYTFSNSSRYNDKQKNTSTMAINPKIHLVENYFFGKVWTGGVDVE